MTTINPPPPVAKYRYTLVVTGNSHEEIVHEVLVQTRGVYLIDSGYEKRDEFNVIGGRSTRTLEHTNPEMTAEKYQADLDQWFEAHKAARR